MSEERSVQAVFGPGSVHMVGDGFHVRNLFPSNPVGERLSPFLLLDYAGPSTYGPSEEPRGVGEHPHRGFETVTIVYQGELEHRDSAGNHGTLAPGDVQWMTAASGIVHEERHERAFARRGGTLEMVQLWVNLPSASKKVAPRYQEIRDARIPSVELAGGAGRARVIAGALGAARGPAETFTPLDVLDVRLSAGKSTELAVPAGHNAAIVCLRGRVAVAGADTLEDAHLALLSPEGTRVALRAEADTTLLLLAGQPIDEPVVSYGPFVMNTSQEIYEAIQDYRSGKMGHLA